jgi:hypothetical protein
MNRYESEAEIESVVRGFETCETDKTEFRHPQHLTVAVWYVHTLGRDAALDHMRVSLMRFLDHHGVDRKKYSEETTVFWIDCIADKLNELGPHASLVHKCNHVIDRDFTDKMQIGSDQC